MSALAGQILERSISLVLSKGSARTRFRIGAAECH